MFDRDDSDEQRGCVAICPMVVRGVLTVGALEGDLGFRHLRTLRIWAELLILHKYAKGVNI